jgi:hypothetical protein
MLMIRHRRLILVTFKVFLLEFLIKTCSELHFLVWISLLLIYFILPFLSPSLLHFFSSWYSCVILLIWPWLKYCQLMLLGMVVASVTQLINALINVQISGFRNRTNSARALRTMAKLRMQTCERRYWQKNSPVMFCLNFMMAGHADAIHTDGIESEEDKSRCLWSCG